MFDQINKEYEKNRKVLEKQEEQLKKQLSTLSEPLTKKVLFGLNTNVTILHANEQLIEKETLTLIKDAAKFNKEVQDWICLYNNLNESLKQVGDIVNWAQVIEHDLNQIVDGSDPVDERQL